MLITAAKRSSSFQVILITIIALVGAVLGGVLVASMSYDLLFLGIGAILGGCLILFRPVVGLYAVVITQFAFVGGEDYVTPTKIASFGLLVLVLAYSTLRWFKSPILTKNEQFWLRPLLIFLGLCGLSLIPATLEGVTLQSWLRELFPLLNYGLILAGLVYIRDQQQFKQLLLVVGSLIFLVLARDFLYSIQAAMRIGAGTPLYNLLVSLFKTPGSPLFSFLALFVALGNIKKQKSFFVRLVLIIAAGFAISVLFLSGTRTFWLGLLVGLISWELVRPRTTKTLPRSVRMILAACLVFIVGWLLSGYLVYIPVVQGLSFNERLATLNPEALADDWSYQARYNETQTALYEVGRSPFLGRGLGYELTSYARPWTREYVTRGFVHNTFVFVLLKLGLIGLTVFIWFLTSLSVRLHRVITSHSNPEYRTLAAIMLALLMALIFISFTTSQLNATQTTVVFSLLIGGLFGATSKSSNPVNTI